jgi:23S rRNA (uracil1939-C5)-methyltransferase
LLEEVSIEKLLHGGQGLGTLPDGRKVFVWNALPGEVVKARLLKSKKGYAEAITEEVVKASSDRVDPQEPASYLATSPWQMMSFEAENKYKKEILSESFAREKVTLPDFLFVNGDKALGYRNKMEFGLWGDDDGIHLAHFVRGSHGKTKVTGSALASAALNNAAAALIAEINTHKMRAGDIKSLMVRTDQAGNAVAALFVKREDFIKLKKPGVLQGLTVYYSNPKSPASVPTRILYEIGAHTLTDKVLGTELHYDVLSFFQVNLPVFEIAVRQIGYQTGGSLHKVDMYSGVGSIGIPIGGTTVLVDIDAANIEMAKKNASHFPIKIVHASTEKALEYITPDACIVVDPPRAGLHADVTQKLVETKPAQVVYLSCNPSTQARDLKQLLDGGYEIKFFEGYNFFPRTPHIESLAVLELKQ